MRADRSEHDDDADWTILELVSERLRGNKNIVLAAVRSAAYELEYASEELKGDAEVALAALAQEVECDYYGDERYVDKIISQQLWRSKDFALAAVKLEGHMLWSCSKDVRFEKDVMLAALAQDISVMEILVSGNSEGFEALESVIKYVKALTTAYSTSVSVFVLTILCASQPPHPTAACTATKRSNAAARPRINSEQVCVLQQLNALGPEGALAFKKRIAAFAGVPYRGVWVCPVAWPAVQKVARGLDVFMFRDLWR